MSTYVIKWNPKRSPWTTLDRNLEEIGRKGFFDDPWFFHKSSRIRRGDRVFLLRTQIAPRGIMGAGVVIDEPSETFHWDDSQPNVTALFVVVRFDTLMHPERDGILPTRHLSAYPRRIQAGGIPIPLPAADELETAWSAFRAARRQQIVSLAEEVTTPARYFEGATRQISVNTYERNLYARQQCIGHYGCRCSVCGFDFEQIFGEVGRGFIHVHHVKPLSEVQEEYEVDPIADLRPICPNCHAMIHRGPELKSIEDLRELIHSNVTLSEHAPGNAGRPRS